MKYKNLYYEFKIIDENFFHQFAFQEDLNKARIYQINAETQSMEQGIKIIIEDINDRLNNGKTVSEEEINFILGGK